MPDNLDDLILDYQNEFGNLDLVEKSKRLLNLNYPWDFYLVDNWLLSFIKIPGVFNNSLVYSDYVDIYNRVLKYFDKNQIFVVDGDNLVG